MTRESSQASLILAQVCQSCDCFAGNAQSPLSGLKDLCIFPIKATCNSNELEDINLRAVNPKKTAEGQTKQREKQREGNEKSTRCEGGRQKKRENVKLIKMKLSRTQGVRERKRGREGEGRFVAEACNIYNS